MRLVSVYDVPRLVTAQTVLWDLLVTREPHVNISHKVMPTWQQHIAFIESKPYEAWYLIDDGYFFTGAIYLSRQREVGLFLLPEHRGEGLGKAALAELRKLHPGRLLANASVRNLDSIAFFHKQGFTLLSVTMELPDV